MIGESENDRKESEWYKRTCVNKNTRGMREKEWLVGRLLYDGCWQGIKMNVSKGNKSEIVTESYMMFGWWKGEACQYTIEKGVIEGGERERESNRGRSAFLLLFVLNT